MKRNIKIFPMKRDVTDALSVLNMSEVRVRVTGGWVRARYQDLNNQIAAEEVFVRISSLTNLGLALTLQASVFCAT